MSERWRCKLHPEAKHGPDSDECMQMKCDALRVEVEQERTRADDLNKSVLKWMADFYNADKAWADERKAHDKMCPDAVRANRAEAALAEAEKNIKVTELALRRSGEEADELERGLDAARGLLELVTFNAPDKGTGFVSLDSVIDDVRAFLAGRLVRADEYVCERARIHGECSIHGPFPRADPRPEEKP